MVRWFSRYLQIVHARSRATWINCDAALVEPTDEAEREVERAIGTNVRGTVGCWNEGDREGKGFTVYRTERDGQKELGKGGGTGWRGILDWRTDAQHDREARCIAFANPQHG